MARLGRPFTVVGLAQAEDVPEVQVAVGHGAVLIAVLSTLPDRMIDDRNRAERHEVEQRPPSGDAVAA